MCRTVTEPVKARSACPRLPLLRRVDESVTRRLTLVSAVSDSTVKRLSDPP